VFAALWVIACGSAPLPDAGDAWRERGAAVVRPFKQKLVAALTEAIAAGGAENAIEVCRVRAPELAREAGAPGIEVGRTSHRLRNPANAPRAWVQPLLAAWVADPASAAPRALRLPSGAVGYVEPILTAPLCLACHGESLEPAVAAKLAAAYPSDRATGFRAGDLRGAFWVELAADAEEGER
jgi:hypothetical protein